MIDTIIIDDELPCINALRHDLEVFCPQVNIVQCCSSAKEGMLAIKKHAPALVFLDIAMPAINGFELLEMLGADIHFHVIFTSAYEHYAVQAFRVSAVDYLLKPVDSDDLKEAVSRVEKTLHGNSSQSARLNNLLANTQLPAEQQVLALPNRDGYDFITAGDIIYCEASGAYTRVIVKNGPALLLSKALGELENMLPRVLFERIHHSLVINLSEIKQFKKSDGTFVVMKNGEKLGVARSRKDRLLQRIGLA